MKTYTSALIIAAFILLSNIIVAQDVPKKEGKKIQEVVTTDSLPADELLKRAVNWIKLESPKYTKAVGVNSGTKTQCTASFKYKPKELNPQVNAEGTITMLIAIDCKDSKYRYSISNMMHEALDAKYSGGDINNEVPAAGTLNMSPEIWKRIRGEANKHATDIITELKEAMKVPSNQAPTSDEW